MSSQKNKPWPADGLERVPNCPVCGSASRSLLHEGLSDNIFFAAPGEWTMWRCGGCGSGYLDPRPTPATIGQAYGHYYTHDEIPPVEGGSVLQRTIRRLANGYRNRRYGARLTPESPIGSSLGLLVPPFRWQIDVVYRFLPRPPRRETLRVLDIGCGGGDWLDVARNAGWLVAGVEPDPIARSRALAKDIDVTETREVQLNRDERFDFITMSHSIEHAHDPARLLLDCYQLLNPGGGLFVDTPNLDALGHKWFGRNWRGLEPPRHLAIFTRQSLFDAVRRAGFASIRYRPRFYPFTGMAEQSRRMAAGLDPLSSETSPNLPPPASLMQRVRAALTTRRTEFLTLTAERPK